jgi:hypothetical protein
MAREPSRGEAKIQINFKVVEAMNPLLARHLGQFNAGRSRHSRLMALATVGLLAEDGMLTGARSAPEAGPKVPSEPAPEGSSVAYHAMLTDEDLADIG